MPEFINPVKQAFDDGRVAWGVGLLDCSDILAKLSVDTGPEFLWIDLEHRAYGPNEVRWVPIICRQAGVSPMIRVPGLDSNWIKKALDIGASTIMVPQIDTAEEARLAVEYCKYPPEGSRGVSPLWPMMMDVDWSDYLPVANAETAVIVQIESPLGLENIDEIAAVDGVDVVFAGPQDIAASMGVIGQPRHPDVVKILDGFPERVGRFGKPAGITDNGYEHASRWRDQGYRFINIGTVSHLGLDGTRDAFQRLRAGNSN
jgi:2-keto-3-deoxy-L-rhamnonate aldolase RhmA